MTQTHLFKDTMCIKINLNSVKTCLNVFINVFIPLGVK